MSENDDWDDDEDYDEYEEEEITPENCSMGSFSPGTEACDFCPHSEFCAEEFRKMVERSK